MKVRNISIDILKCIGILSIILAHVKKGGIITQARSFDVTMLVIISGLLATQSYDKTKSVIKYINKRIIRLIAPTWIFLTLFFIGCYIVKTIFNINTNILSIKNILKSYFFIDGIGYVWIIRVYILAAISVPILVKLSEKIPLNIKKQSILIIFFSFVIYEIAYYFLRVNNKLVNYVLYYFWTYGIICSYIGMKLEKLENKKILILGIVMLMVWIIYAIILYKINGHFIYTYIYKYPPRFYYLSYSIGITLILYFLIERKNLFNIKNILNNKVIIFVSSHSMWIYLWHILFIYLFKKIYLFWIIKYIIVVLLSLSFTYVQSEIVKKLNIKNKTILSILNS